MMKEEKPVPVEVVKEEPHVPTEDDIVKEDKPVEIIMWMGTEVASPIPIEQLFSNNK